METIPSQENRNDSGQGMKKALLNKLMSNLLDKPGRSMHEIINGVKEAISAYRNYAKEWDILNGVVAGEDSSTALGAPGAGGNKDAIQGIMEQIRQQKAGGPSPVAPMPAPAEVGAMPPPPMAPIPPDVGPSVPQGALQDELIAGQPQSSDFNRPAPVSNLGIRGF